MKTEEDMLMIRMMRTDTDLLSERLLFSQSWKGL